MRRGILALFCLSAVCCGFVIFLACVSTCFAQDYPLANESVDCADLVSSERNVEAFSCFGNAIESDPTSALDWAGQGDVMNNIGYYYQALVYYNMAIDLDPSSANILTSKGRTLTRLGKYDEAMNIFSQALELRPDNAYTWRSIGDVYTLRHDTDKAEAAYSKAEAGKQHKSVEDYL
jgi:tetratricopeptide (TPR) repeat protein